MSKQEVKAQGAKQWLEHLQRCEAPGGSTASYAKEHGLAAWALYQWCSRLVRKGLWPANTPDAKHDVRSAVAMHFACVAVTTPTPAYVVRLQLGNGRRRDRVGTH